MYAGVPLFETIFFGRACLQTTYFLEKGGDVPEQELEYQTSRRKAVTKLAEL
jgi:hypothetical protein